MLCRNWNIGAYWEKNLVNWQWRIPLTEYFLVVFLLYQRFASSTSGGLLQAWPVWLREKNWTWEEEISQDLNILGLLILIVLHHLEAQMEGPTHVFFFFKTCSVKCILKRCFYTSLVTRVVGANVFFSVLPWCSWVTPTEWLPNKAVCISRLVFESPGSFEVQFIDMLQRRVR